MSKWRKQGRWLLEYRGETSMFDPRGQWKYGSEYCERVFRAWIPNSISKADVGAQIDYLEKHPNAHVE